MEWKTNQINKTISIQPDKTTGYKPNNTPEPKARNNQTGGTGSPRPPQPTEPNQDKLEDTGAILKQ